GMGPDLDFEHLVFRPHHSGMQRAIAIFLRRGDVIIKFVGDITPETVDDPQHGVAIPYCRHQDAYRPYIVDLGKVDTLALHLAPDAVNMFRAPGNLAFDTRCSQL